MNSSPSIRSIKLCWKLAIRELMNHRKFSFFLIINLSLGLLSFLIIDSISESLKSYLLQNSRSIATADIVLYGNRTITEAELKIIQEESEIDQMSSRSDYFTMMESKDQSRLTRAQVFSPGYPFYGQLIIKDFSGNIIPWETVSREMEKEPIALISPELRYLFSKEYEKDTPIETDEKIKIGNEEFKARYIIEKDVEQMVGARSLSYKVMIASSQHKANLKKKGNTVRYRYYFKQKNSETPSSEIAKRLNEKFKVIAKDRTPLKARAHDEGGGFAERIIRYIYNYLGLICLVTLFLSGIGAFYLFRNFIYQKLQDIAIMESLGMKKWQTFLEAIFQLIILGGLSVLVTIVMYLSLRPGIPFLFGSFLPSNLAIELNLTSILFISTIALLGPILFTLPLILSILSLEPIYLIKKSFHLEGNKKIYFWGLLPSVIAFYFLSSWVSGSFLNGRPLGSVRTERSICDSTGWTG